MKLLDLYNAEIWIACHCCDEFWCRSCDMHAFECACEPED